MKTVVKGFAALVASLVCIFYLNSCRKVDIEIATTSDLNIFPYLQNEAKFSEWAKIVDKAGYSGFLTAYGAYTMFAPNNDAIKLYLAEINKASTDALTEVEAQNLVKFHVLQDTLGTQTFKDGKLPTVTMFGQYLVAGVTNENGVSSVTINRQANITQGNIKTGNGYIHEISRVLKAATKSTAQLVAENPDFSIFTQALKATGFYDTLDKVSTSNPKRFYTLLAESNKALADSGFTSYTALFNRLSNTGNPLNPLDSLHIYVAYHIIPDAKYIADIASANSQISLQPLEVLTTSNSGDTILINELEFNGIREKGVVLNRLGSDVSTTTGVLHSALGHFRPKVRVPFPVYWDVADFPEVRKLPAIFRRSTNNFAYGTVKDFNWNNPANTLSYRLGSSTVPTFYNDYLLVPMGNTSRHNWIEFRTPLLVKGRYKMWICYRAAKGSGTVGTTPGGGSQAPCKVSFDGVPTERTFNFSVMRPNGSDGELEALGWKKYMIDTRQESSGKYVGVVNVAATDRHIVRFDVLPEAGTGNPECYLDMIHFIPVDWPSQVLPRFGRNGEIVYQ